MRKEDLSFLGLLRIKGVFFALFTSFVSVYAVSFHASFLSIRIKELGVDRTDIGYYYMFMVVPYLPMCILTPIIFKRVPKKLDYIISFIFTGIGLGLMGPS